MNRLKLILGFVLYPIIVSSQIDTIYINSQGKVTDSDSATYVRIMERSDALIKVKDYNTDNKLTMIGSYKSIAPEIEEGDFEFYDSKGNKVCDGSFINGVMVGDWSFYKKNGKLDNKINYDFEVKIDPNLSAKELMQGGTLIVPDMPKFETGYLPQFEAYLYSNFVTPMIVKKYNLKGRTAILFIVNEKGEVVNVSFLKSIDPQVDLEILRVISNSPKWTPALNEKGEKMSVPFTLRFEIK